LAYAGGKWALLTRQLRRIPPHKCYGEVFVSGGALIGAKDPGQSQCEVINDVDGDLANFYRVASRHPEAVQIELSRVARSRTLYEAWRRMDDAQATDVERAARYVFCLYNTFGKRPRMDSFGTVAGNGGVGYPVVLQDVVGRVFSRLHDHQVTVECLDFEDFIRRYDRPETFFYCDPPYLGTDEHACRMSLEDHQRLAGCLAGVKGKWLLSMADGTVARRMYRGFTIEAVKVRYHLSRTKDAAGHDGRELLIRNYRTIPGA
jgi:DNA adenine methylase